MRAATQFMGPIPHADDPHRVAVLLPEQRHRAHVQGLGLRHVVGGDRHVLKQHLVDVRLGVLQHAFRDGLGEREVETQPARGVLRTHLGGGLAQHLAERLVNHVGRGMGSRDRPASLDVDHTHRGGTDHGLAVQHSGAVHPQARDRHLHVIDLEGRAVVKADQSVVAELAAGFGVERAAVQHHLDRLPGPGGRDALTVDEQSLHAGLGLPVVIAGELRLAGRFHDLPVGGQGGDAGLTGHRIGLGTLALLCHQRGEPVPVHLKALLGGQLQGQVDREPVGVVQREGIGPGHRGGTARLRVGDRRVEHGGTAAQRLPETLLLADSDGLDAAGVGGEVGVLRRHARDDAADQFAHRGLVGSEQSHVEHHTAQQAAQHVAAALVSGQNTVGDQERAGTRVIGHHA